MASAATTRDRTSDPTPRPPRLRLRPPLAAPLPPPPPPARPAPAPRAVAPARRRWPPRPRVRTRDTRFHAPDPRHQPAPIPKHTRSIRPGPGSTRAPRNPRPWDSTQGSKASEDSTESTVYWNSLEHGAEPQRSEFLCVGRFLPSPLGCLVAWLVGGSDPKEGPVGARARGRARGGPRIHPVSPARRFRARAPRARAFARAANANARSARGHRCDAPVPGLTRGRPGVVRDD